MDVSKLLGLYVHFPDGEGNLYEGTIVAAWREKTPKGKGITGTPCSDLRICAACRDNRFRDAWLTNTIQGAIPKPKELQGGI